MIVQSLKSNPARTVTALLLNYLHWQDTVDCVQSLLRCSYSALRIVIVDNGSPNKSEEMLKKSFPMIPVHQTGKNLGYTGGINFGYRIILSDQPDYVLILNPDTLVDPEFLRLMVDEMERTPSAAASCCTILYHRNSERIWYAGGRMVPWRGLAVHNHTLPLFHGPRTNAQVVSFVTGCVILQRASTIRDIGFQDERFFMYLDDIEFSARVRKKGYSLVYVPHATIYHRVQNREESPFKLYYSVRNRLLVINSAFVGFDRTIAAVYFVIVIVLKLLFWSVTRPILFKAGYSGLWDYFAGNFGEGRGVKDFSG